MQSSIIELGALKTGQDSGCLPWPATVNEAVDQLFNRMGADVKEKVGRIENSEDMICYHHTLGQWIRNNFGLWKGNEILSISCCEEHPDDASFVILKALWGRCRNELS